MNVPANYQGTYLFEADEYNNSANWGAAGTAVMPCYNP